MEIKEEKKKEEHIIQNFDSLATNEERKLALHIVEAGLNAIQPQQVLKNHFSFEYLQVKIEDKILNLRDFERIFVVGFGKGAAGICKMLENNLGDFLTGGFVIDVVDESFTKLKYTKGTHPLPSAENIKFTQEVLDTLTDLSQTDLVIVVICGGGSAMFEVPYKITLETLIEINKALLKSGANIAEMNIVRKHLSKVKGGGFAKHLYPASIVSLIFSDVPGNDLFVIASGPTINDPTTLADVEEVINKYQLEDQVKLEESDFHETPKDEKYFSTVSNILIMSNLTALEAMKKKAEELGAPAFIYSDRIQGNSKHVGEELINAAKHGHVLLAGGETTAKITGSGKGGRNQALVLGALPFITDGVLIVSFDTDGLDFYGYAGAIGDSKTVKRAIDLGLDTKSFLDNDDSYTFFERVGDGIMTGKLESNVSDLFIVIKL